MKTPPRDGVITANGLSADFRFVRDVVTLAGAMGSWSMVETAMGQHVVDDSRLEYDPVRDLSPEAAAVVAEHKEKA